MVLENHFSSLRKSDYWWIEHSIHSDPRRHKCLSQWGKKFLKKFNTTELLQYPVTAQWMVELQSPWKGQQAIGRLWFIQYSEGMAYSPFFLSKTTFSQAEIFAGLAPQQIAPYKLIQDFYLQLKQFSPRKP